MIKLKFESAGHPDYSRIVGAEMDKEYTVVEFINEILEMYPKDHGEINIDDNIFLDYKNGALDWSFMNLRLSGLVVEKVEGISSYYNTNYKLMSKKDTDKQEKKQINIEDMLDEISSEMQEMKRKYKEKYGLNIASILVSKHSEKALKTDYENGVIEIDIVV